MKTFATEGAEAAGREKAQGGEVVRLSDSVTIIRGNCFAVPSSLWGGADAVIADPPFSARTHAGHDAIEGGGYDMSERLPLGYSAWSVNEVRRVCERLPSRGWVCILTDYVLAREWESVLSEVGRYVFSPVPLVTRGRSVRLTGDGPSSWMDSVVVARTVNELRWGTLPGLYEGARGTIEHMGGKPLNAMCRIVEDYSRAGDTVLDFCMGSGTTGIACIRTGRKFVGIEIDPVHFATARARLERELAQPHLPALCPSVPSVAEHLELPEVGKV